MSRAASAIFFASSHGLWFAMYWSAADRSLLRKWILLVASLVFYMAWNPAPVVLVLYRLHDDPARTEPFRT